MLRTPFRPIADHIACLFNRPPPLRLDLELHRTVHQYHLRMHAGNTSVFATMLAITVWGYLLNSNKDHQGGSYIRQSSTSFQPHAPLPPHIVAGRQTHQDNNNDNHTLKSFDVSVSQTGTGGREADDMELIDSDGWRGMSKQGTQYVSSTGDRRPR